MNGNLYDDYPGITELKTGDFTKGSVVPKKPQFANKVSMVIFYAPWCGHCRNMVKDVKDLANALKDEGFVIGTVNCDANSDINTVYPVESFPTIFFIKDNQATEYKGSRDLDSLVKFLCETLGTCKKK